MYVRYNKFVTEQGIKYHLAFKLFNDNYGTRCQHIRSLCPECIAATW